MKKVSTLKLMALLCTVPFLVNGQSASRLEIRNSAQASKFLKIEAGQEVPVVNLAQAPATVRNTSKTVKRSATATIVGNTTYDLQSNAAMPRRIIAYPNGKISTVWTGSSEASSWTDRGTRYNSFDGTTWGAAPTAKLESKRVGWGNLSAVTGGEVVVCHVNGVTTNTGVGTAFGATRTAGEFGGLTWPRTASVGNTIHAIIGTSAGDTETGFLAPVYYGKSTDGGANFDTVSAAFGVAAGYDSLHHAGDVGGDSYAIDANGSTVAILILGTTEDVVLMKSTDAGATWTKKIIREFPIAKYVGGITDANGDTVADTLLGVTSNGSVVVDNNGAVHVAFCDLLVLDPDGAGLSVFLTATSDYINYWNDTDTTLIQVPTLLDLNANGTFDSGSDFTGATLVRYGNSGFTLNPMLSVGATGTAWANGITLTYCAVAEEDTNDVGVDFRNIYITGTADHGANWFDIVNVSQTANQENMFVTVPAQIGADGKVHMQWQQDFDPGNAVQGAHASSVADIIYDAVDISGWNWSGVGVNNTKKLDASIVAYPNPTSDFANLNITMNNASKAEVKLVNMLGQTVRTMSVELTAGSNKVAMNVADLSAGLYSVVLTSNGQSATEKIMVK
jgi:hypothetical protein